MKGDWGPGKPYLEIYVKVSYGISLLIYEDNAHGTDSDRMCEVATLAFARTSDSSVRSGVSCDTINIDTSSGEERTRLSCSGCWVLAVPSSDKRPCD